MDARSPVSAGRTQFGVQIGALAGPLSDLRELWRFADDQGFDCFFLSDHFQDAPTTGGSCLEGLTTLACLASETSHVRIGSMVSAVPYRNPALMAKMFTTIDHISDGRVECGVGAGWNEAEARAYDIWFPPVAERFERLEEAVCILRSMFDDGRVDFDGEHYHMQNAPNLPKPVQERVPICIGGGGERRTLPLAARYADVWNAVSISPSECRRKNQLLDQLCHDVGRDPREVLRSVNLGFYMGADRQGVERHEARWRSEWGWKEDVVADRSRFLLGTPSDVGALLEQFVGAGVQRVNVSLRGGPYDLDALAVFVTDVMPAFTGPTAPARA